MLYNYCTPALNEHTKALSQIGERVCTRSTIDFVRISKPATYAITAPPGVTFHMQRSDIWNPILYGPLQSGSSIYLDSGFWTIYPQTPSIDADFPVCFQEIGSLY